MKKIASIFTAFLLGVLGLTVNAANADAHQGNIKVTASQCVDGNSMKATYTVGWTNGTSSGKLYTKEGLYSGGTSTSGWDFVKNVSGASGSESFTLTHSFSGSNGPWVSFKIIFSDNYVVGGDTRVEGWSWDKCKPPQPADNIVHQNIDGTCDTTYQSKSRDGIQEYVWDSKSNSWVLEDESKISWGAWNVTNWTDDSWFKSCAPDKPKDIVDHKSDKNQDCTGVYETSWDMVTGHVWNPSTRKWDETTPTKENFVDWHRTGDVSNEYYDANCKPAPVKVTKHFQVDTYSNPTQKLANKAARYDNDGKLKWGEDKAHYGHSHYQTIKVKGLSTWTNAQWRTAINKATTKSGVKNVNSSSHTKSLKKGQKLTVAWLIHGDWRHHPQTFFARGIA